MKSVASRIVGFAFGMLVVMFIFHDDRLPFWWHTYSDPGGDFSLEFPGKPRAADQQLKLDAGGTGTVKMVAATPNKTTSHLFTYYDGPRVASKTVEEELDGVRDGAISKIHGALLHEQRIQIDGHQARDVQARDEAGSILNMRFIVDRQRLVILEVATAGPKADSKSVQKFFSSLKLAR